MIKDAYLIIAMQHGEDNVMISSVLNSQGMLYKKQGKFDRAIDSYQRCLSIREQQLGEEHPETCAVRHNMGQLYEDWEKPEQAKQFFDKNVEVMSKRVDKEKEGAQAASPETNVN